ncbi:hypothetical protein H6F90_11055 [Trichocoleus sp. FACHB-591]|uniref:hypothetical protein n=1 Tax=Trichocoleus sp. FACHB-591 TaxID=2692872 RepID=UPI001682043B|nr:hypothetical protein [Trichocoleus sp. FACHB-591]MBD2095692.1 hypothetical protein [Trichocoleus sp. FACHB-591]
MLKMTKFGIVASCDRLSSQWFEAYYKKHASIRFRQCLKETYNTSSQTEKSRGAIARASNTR